MEERSGDDTEKNEALTEVFDAKIKAISDYIA
jgi:hypothetical protein